MENPDRDPEIDLFLAGLVEACHNIAIWIVKYDDPRARFLSFITGLRPDVREWLEERLRDIEAWGV